MQIYNPAMTVAAILAAKHAGDRELARQGRAALTALKDFIGGKQALFVRQLMHGEEKNFFFEKMIELNAIVEAMPKTYEQDGKGDQAVAYLHYFGGGQANWWITEKDKTEGEPQWQAFGLCDLFGDGGELGYVSLPELFDLGVELDFHFTPKTLGEIRKKALQPEAQEARPSSPG